MPWKSKKVLDGRCTVSLGLELRSFAARNPAKTTHRSTTIFAAGDYHGGQNDYQPDFFQLFPASITRIW